MLSFTMNNGVESIQILDQLTSRVITVKANIKRSQIKIHIDAEQSFKIKRVGANNNDGYSYTQCLECKLEYKDKNLIQCPRCSSEATEKWYQKIGG